MINGASGRIKLIIIASGNFNKYNVFKRELYNYLVKQKFSSIQILCGEHGPTRCSYTLEFAGDYNIDIKYFNCEDAYNANILQENKAMIDYAIENGRPILFSFGNDARCKSLITLGIKKGIEIHQILE